MSEHSNKSLASISAQLVVFIHKHEREVNAEDFATLEFVIVDGKLDGMRTKRFIKNRESR